MSKSGRIQKERRKGFTLAELTLAVLLVGGAAAFTVPRYLNTVERGRAAEAFEYLAAVHAAQEAYREQHGAYAGRIADLELGPQAGEHFVVGRILAPSHPDSLESGWMLELTRKRSLAGFGAYNVIFNQEGFDALRSTIPAEVNPLRPFTEAGR